VEERPSGRPWWAPVLALLVVLVVLVATGADAAALAGGPAFTVDPETGHPGDEVVVSGIDCPTPPAAGDVAAYVRFLGQEVETTDGQGSARLAVPDAEPGVYTITYDCAFDPPPPETTTTTTTGPIVDVKRSAGLVPAGDVGHDGEVHFTLLTASPPQAAVTPAEARRGEVVTVTGGGCGDRHTVDVILGAATVPVQQQGDAFTARMTIPELEPGSHPIVVRCHHGPERRDDVELAFAVRAGPVSTTTSTTTTSTTTTSTSTTPTTTSTPTTLPPGSDSRPARRPAFVLALSSPGDLSFALPLVAVNLAAAAAIVLVFLLGFPPDPFNAALERLARHLRHQYPRWSRGRRRLPGHPLMLVAFGVVAAALVTAAAPSLHPDAPTLRLFAGLAVAVTVTTAVIKAPAVVLSPDRAPGRLRVRALVAGLVLAGVLAACGRLGGLEPPYVYGLVAVFEIVAVDGTARAAGPARDGVAALAGAVGLLVVSVAAWLAWGPIDDGLGRDAGGLALALDATLAALVVTGLTSLVIGYLPLRYMEGLPLFRWSRPAWAVVWGSGVFVVLQILANPNGRDELLRVDAHVTPWVPLLVFVAFGVATLCFRRFVDRLLASRRSPRRLGPDRPVPTG
jgi:hypothetical protein